MSCYNKYIFFLASSPLLKKDIYICNYTIHLRSNIALPLFLYISLENVDIFMFHPNNNHYNFILEDTAVERQHDRLTQGALNFHKHPRELIICMLYFNLRVLVTLGGLWVNTKGPLYL